MSETTEKPPDKIDEAFNKYATNGWFSKDPYYPWKPLDPGVPLHMQDVRKEDKPSCFYIQFTAYDGYHVVHTCATDTEADAVLLILNGFKDPVKCRTYLNKLKDGVNTVTHSLAVKNKQENKK